MLLGPADISARECLMSPGSGASHCDATSLSRETAHHPSQGIGADPLPQAMLKASCCCHRSGYLPLLRRPRIRNPGSLRRCLGLALSSRLHSCSLPHLPSDHARLNAPERARAHSAPSGVGDWKPGGMRLLGRRKGPGSPERAEVGEHPCRRTADSEAPAHIAWTWDRSTSHEELDY